VLKFMTKILGLIVAVSVPLMTGCIAPQSEKTLTNSMDACTAVASANFEGTTISVTTAVPASDALPAYCRIEGVINPNIGFEARFPTTDWNGKYFQAGCGGFCGSIRADKPGYSNSINEALKRGYAAITTDGGHKGTSMGDATWARDNVEAEEIYAHKGVYLVRKAGVRLVKAFYSNDPDYTYFSGCSTGGRMAAMTAQRYPDLFDGILSGGGVLNLSGSGGLFGTWKLVTNTDEDGNPILDYRFALKLKMLAREAINQCDTADGVKDGIIAAPRSCSMDISRIQICGPSGGDDCLTDKEAAVVTKWYQGPQNSKGEQLFPGVPPGSEPFWEFWFLGTEEKPAIGGRLGGGYLKYLGLEEDLDDSYSFNDFDFDRDPVRLETKGRLFNATDPDLRAFEATGGKMIMYHGLADPLVLPDNSIDYFESVLAEMGGREKIHDFFRFFAVPGMGHCWELPAETPDRFDPIAAIEAWVEKGTAPDFIPAHTLDPTAGSSRAAALCPYPQAAVQFQDSDADLTGLCVAEPVKNGNAGTR